MKTNVKWHKEQINGKWYSVADKEHIPMIEHTKEGYYSVKDSNGKKRIEKNFNDAKKFALEVYKKFEKFNKSWNG